MKKTMCVVCFKPAHVTVKRLWLPLNYCLECAKKQREFHRHRLAQFNRQILEAEQQAKALPAPAIPERYEPQTS